MTAPNEALPTDDAVDTKAADATTMDSIVGDPTPENPAEAGSAAVDVELEREPAPAVDAPALDGGGAVAAGEPADTPPVEDVIDAPVQREDGKWALGKYVADDLAGLVVQVEKGRRNAEKLVGRRAEPADPNANPFVAPEDPEGIDDGTILEDDENVFDEADLGSVFGASIAQALVQSGLVPQQQPADSQQAVQQTLMYAQQVIDSPTASDDDFRGVLTALVLNAPNDARSREAVLQEWAARNPVAAAQEAARIETAFAQFAFEQQQQQALAQQQQLAQQEYDAQQQVEVARAAEAEAFTSAQQAFMERNPDWQQHNDAMNAWFAQNRPLLERAKGDRAAIYAVFNSAVQYARAVGGAGVPPRVSEQGGNMGPVPHTPYTDPAAAARQAIAEDRGLAGLETGAAVDDVVVRVSNPNPPGLAETPLTELIGLDLVN